MDAKKPKKRDEQIIEQSALISLNPPAANDFYFMHSILCQVGLPRKKVLAREFTRRQGDAWISIQAGLLDEGDGPVEQLIPYGALPRLIFAYVCTYAIRFKTKEVPIGNNAAEFLEMLGLERTGKRYSNLSVQMNGFAACRFQLGFKGTTINAQPINQINAWQPKRKGRESHWPCVLILSEEFCSSLDEHAVPWDKRAMKHLKGTALGLDMYFMFVRRLCEIPRDKPLILSWDILKKQFGQEYQHTKQFRDEFLRVLRVVKAAYPAANVETIHGGLILRWSPPPIPEKILE